jgi:minor extracellular serine protease Vpr
MQLIRALAGIILFFDTIAFSSPAERYALILGDPALGKRPDTARRAKLLQAQETVQAVLKEQQIAVTGSTQALLNAIFVTAPPERIPELRALAGITAVARMPRLTRKLNKALDLVNASAGWSAVGGGSNAGAGIKIAILDTGIDETHPGFQDSSLPMPAGFPKTGSADDATHATNKIIAVRSFVTQLALGDGTPESTRPDDLSARDRVGHGTAVAMIAAGVSHLSPVGTISGVAPKAWLGNYKIFGSPGVNDSTTADVVLLALEAALNDGMDVALLSAGDLSAMWSPGDQGAACALAAGTPCDPWTAVVSNAALGGMVVVLPAGNDGDFGWSTINTPGDSPAAITVGATTNAHTIASTVSTPAGDRFQARSGDGPQVSTAISAPLLTVSTLDATEHGCLGYPAESLTGTIALVTVGECTYATKVMKAQAAGAAAVLIFNQPGGPALFQPTGLSNTSIPTALISNDSGAALKEYLKRNPGVVVQFDPAPAETPTAQPSTVAHFSSRGPDIGDMSIKPDIAAPGDSIYTAAQNYDPNGDLYNASRYIGVDGTSFAAAFAAGAAALVKEAKPAYSAGQIKSALANTASTSVTDSDAGGNIVPARAIAVGGGKLDVGSAVASTLTVEPVSVAFGALTSALPARSITITNTGAAAANVKLSVQPRDHDSSATVSVSPAVISLAAGQSMNVVVALTGSVPPPGLYEGAISVSGGAVPLHIPYLYLVGSGTPYKLIPLLGQNFVTEAGTAVAVAFRVVDPYGVPVQGKPVRFAPPDAVYAATSVTDNLGIAEAYLRTPNLSGDQSFTADLQGNAGRIQFDGRTRPLPQVAPNGVVNTASFQVPGGGFAPGSYVTIFGTGLSESSLSEHTASLPLSLAGVSVSFDVASAGVHVPGRLLYVSGSEAIVQLPWELAGVSSATMKVTLNNSLSRNVRPDNSNLGTYQSQTFTVPIGAFSPAFFEYVEASSGRTLAAALDGTGVVSDSANPVQRGHVVQFYMNGLGAVAPSTQPPSGDPATGTPPLAITQTVPSVTIGGQSSTVQFSGLAPFLIGGYQVNAIVPLGIGSGIQPVVLSIGGVGSKPSSLFVQ